MTIDGNRMMGPAPGEEPCGCGPTATWGLADAADPRYLGGHVDGQGMRHDPLRHADDCPLDAQAHTGRRKDMIDPPTRKEWLAAWERVSNVPEAGISDPTTDAITEAALGPCPSEPAPEPFRARDGRVLVRILAPDWIAILDTPGHPLTPGEARAMAAALVEHADYAREQGATAGTRDRGGDPLKAREWAYPAPIDGGLVTDNPSFEVGTSGWRDAPKETVCGARLAPGRDGHWSCQSPKGHAGACDGQFIGTPICRRLLVSRDSEGRDRFCQLLKGHVGICQSVPDGGLADATVGDQPAVECTCGWTGDGWNAGCGHISEILGTTGVEHSVQRSEGAPDG